LRSTSGVYLKLAGPNTSFPLAGLSKKQTCVSHSTTESEIVAADLAARSEGLPALQLWETILDRAVELRFYEDNQACITIVGTGRNPQLRHLGRTHKVDVQWLHEMFADAGFQLEYIQSDDQAADIFTKAFTSVEKWRVVTWLINHVEVDKLTGQRPKVPEKEKCRYGPNGEVIPLPVKPASAKPTSSPIKPSEPKTPVKTVRKGKENKTPPLKVTKNTQYSTTALGCPCILSATPKECGLTSNGTSTGPTDQAVRTDVHQTAVVHISAQNRMHAPSSVHTSDCSRLARVTDRRPPTDSSGSPVRAPQGSYETMGRNRKPYGFISKNDPGRGKGRGRGTPASSTAGRGTWGAEAVTTASATSSSANAAARVHLADGGASSAHPAPQVAGRSRPRGSSPAEDRTAEPPMRDPDFVEILPPIRRVVYRHRSGGRHPPPLGVCCSDCRIPLLSVPEPHHNRPHRRRVGTEHGLKGARTFLR
jgi:hypothetical protein